MRLFPARGGDHRQQVIYGGRERGNSEQDHNETRATPQTTSMAPAHRRALTRSFRTYCASTVSMAYVTAETGTAKLRSVIESSFINAKKDTPMAMTEPMTKRFRASTASAR